MSGIYPKPAVRLPPPIVGQLQDGRWAVFNLPATGLWQRTFETKRDAELALEWHMAVVSNHERARPV